MESQIDAVIGVLEELKLTAGSESINIGLSVFAESAKWLEADKKAVRPDADLPIDEIVGVLETEFANGGSKGSTDLGLNEHGVDITASPACVGLGDFTNAGMGLVFMHDYFDSPQSSSTAKKVELLVTDGEPNASSAYPACHLAFDCPGNDTSCQPYARDFVRCALQKEGETWQAETSMLPGGKYLAKSGMVSAKAMQLLAYGEDPNATPTPGGPVPTNGAGGSSPTPEPAIAASV
jgi:hypothetical protein